MSRAIVAKQDSQPKQAAVDPPARHTLGTRLLIELVIGLGLAGVLLLVAWGSSSAIRFVYGGY